MKAFADLYARLDETTKTSEKVEALRHYFDAAPAADTAWAVFFLTGRKLRQAVPTPRLRAWAVEAAGIPEWPFQECYDAVGDVAETIALLLPTPEQSSDRSLADWVEDVLGPLRGADESAQKHALLGAWSEMDHGQRFVWNKLITGGFRVGVSAQLVIRALGLAYGIEPSIVAHRMMGDWTPSPQFLERLRNPASGDADASQPYPFCLAHPLDSAPETLGSIDEWHLEWKWDGIRSQLIKRGGRAYLWSRGEELVTERFPELAEVGARLAEGTVLDAEVLPYRDGHPLPFAVLQTRIGRKTVGKAVLAKAPVVLMAYDLLEDGGRDLRSEPFEVRRTRLAAHVAAVGSDRLLLSPEVTASNWEQAATKRLASRETAAEGLMHKRRSSPYRVGRQRGDWWKWKVDPLTVDAVLIAAQRGSGKRASLYTDYTFGVWDNGRLVPIAKAYSGLTDEEIDRVDAFVRKTMVEAFGPVRTLTPTQVFELGFEAIQRSPRHKSGVAVRFPRILRWRTDKPVDQADTLDMVKALLAPEPNPTPKAPPSPKARPSQPLLLPMDDDSEDSQVKK